MRLPSLHCGIRHARSIAGAEGRSGWAGAIAGGGDLGWAGAVGHEADRVNCDRRWRA